MNRFEKWSVLVTAALTALTGIAYFGFKYLMTPEEPWAVINHPLQPWVLKAHILVAPLLVFSVGMIALRHIWQHFRRGVRWGRRSGLTAAVPLAPMIVSGYLIQAIPDEGWLRVAALVHIGFSFLFTAGIAVHAVVAAPKARPMTVESAGIPLRGETDELGAYASRRRVARGRA